MHLQFGTEARCRLIERVQASLDALGEELLALFPRNCDRMAIQPDLQFKPGGIIPLGNINVR